MSSFLPEFLERQPITVQLLSTCRAIGEFKGKQLLFAQQSPERLEQLRQVAVATHNRGEMSICTETYIKAENVTEQTSQ